MFISRKTAKQIIQDKLRELEEQRKKKEQDEQDKMQAMVMQISLLSQIKLLHNLALLNEMECSYYLKKVHCLEAVSNEKIVSTSNKNLKQWENAISVNKNNKETLKDNKNHELSQC